MGGYFYLFRDFPDQTELSVNKIINKALRMYEMCWKIEEVHRHLKQVYGWEKDTTALIYKTTKHEPDSFAYNVLSVFTEEVRT